MDAVFGLSALAFWISALAAWVTHMVWSIKLLMSVEPALVQQMVLAIIGVLVPPVAIIHGYILWFV